MTQVSYQDVRPVEERYPGTDELSLLQRELFSYMERRLTALDEQLLTHPSTKRYWRAKALVTLNELPDRLHELRSLVAGDEGLRQALGRSVPKSATLRNIFMSPPRAKRGAVEQLIWALSDLDGVHDAEGVALLDRWDELTAGPATVSDTREERQAASDDAALALEIMRQREAWDEAEPGSSGYRDPMLSLPDVNPPLLPQALLMVQRRSREGSRLGVSDTDLAYCLYSACKHGDTYLDWYGYCLSNRPAAGAMVDFVGWRKWIRPGLRAAWCLSKMDAALRAEAVAYAREQYAKLEGVAELLDAVDKDDVPGHVTRLLAESVAAGDDERVKKHQELLDEWNGLTRGHLRGGRSVFG